MQISLNIALLVIWVPTSAADFEISFTFVNLVENRRRTNLSDISLKDHLYCCYNKLIELGPKISQKQNNADFI